MVVTLIILLATCAALLTGLVYYKGKYWNYLEILDAAAKDSENTLNEMRTVLDKEKKKFENKCLKNYKKKLKRELDTKLTSLEERYNELAKNLELDYTNACEEIQNELIEQLQEVDNAVTEHAKNLAAKNILTFSCSCSRDLIPCAIDFTKENTFVCPKCGSKYKVLINANPVLIGRSITDEEFAELVEERLNDSKREN